MPEITKKPDKYKLDRESLGENKYIDDNSLFVYYCISRDFFNGKNNPISFLYLASIVVGVVKTRKLINLDGILLIKSY